MTDEERYIAQGRARDEARKTRAEMATLRASFEEYSEQLVSLKGLIATFLSDPMAKVADGKPVVDYVNATQQKLAKPGFTEMTFEYSDSVRKLRKLEEQIKDF
jgi:hypothetical protein